jgi:hypothetical protein
VARNPDKIGITSPVRRASDTTWVYHPQVKPVFSFPVSCFQSLSTPLRWQERAAAEFLMS